MAKIVDEYSLSLGPSEAFPTVLLTIKLDNGLIEGPYEFVPAFAHQLADELCISAARAAKRITGASELPTKDANDGG
jgi:hypothetical protein